MTDVDVRRLPERFISRVRAAVGVYMVVLAASGDPHFDYYPELAWGLTIFVVGYALVVLRYLSRPWYGRLPRWAPWILVASDTLMIAGLAGVTGGAQSPIAPVLLLVLVGAAIRFGLRRGAAALAWTVPALAALILLVPEPQRPTELRVRDALWWTGHLSAGAVLAGVLADRLDLARRRRSQAESQAEAERQRLELERVLRRRLEDLDGARREFLASLLHEFRPSVASISTLSRALRRDEDELNPQERAGMLDRMAGCGAHLEAVLREVAEVLVTESLGAEHSQQQADVYLPQVTGQAATMAGLGLERLETRLEPGLTVIRSDPDKLLRVLAKLLEDATRASPPSEPVTVEIRRHDDGVEISVADRRPGAAEDHAGPAPSLGSWVAARLAEGMGGGTMTEPRPGGGLVVRLSFPIGPEPRSVPDRRRTSDNGSRLRSHRRG